MTAMRGWNLRKLMDEAASALDTAVESFSTDVVAACRFVMSKADETSDGESGISTASEGDEEEFVATTSNAPGIFFSMSSQARAKVHLHLQPWGKFDPAATPLCKRRQKAGQPLVNPIAVGEGLSEAAGIGRICADCTRVYKAQ
jgi:hypothetical protein